MFGEEQHKEIQMSIWLGNKKLAGSVKLYSGTGQNTDGAMTQKATTNELGKKLGSNQISNCITHIPQDIKLELNNGTLTLKAGSKVYVPNGAGVFDKVVIPSDIVYPRTGVDTLVLVIRTDTLEIKPTTIQFVSSGDTDPQAGVQYHLWYDTANNIIKKYEANTQTPAYTSSFPFAVIKVGVDKIESIENIFNGFGYIGSTVFVLPGVKGLIPDGRNADGSLKNIECNVTSVRTLTLKSQTYSAYFGLTEEGLNGAEVGYFLYDEKINRIRVVNGSSLWNACIYAVGKIVSGKITEFTPKTVFHSVDYNDSEYIAHNAMPSDRYIDLTVGASGTEYVAPADGYFKVSGFATGSNQTINMDCNKIGFKIWSVANGNELKASSPIRKGDKLWLGYSMPQANVSIRFIYAEGAQ